MAVEPSAVELVAVPRRVTNWFHYAWTVLLYVALVVCAAIILLPLYLTVVDALLKTEELISFPPDLFPRHPQWHNFKDAWDTGRLQRYMLNSFIVSAIITVGQVTTSAMAAYAFAFLDFPGRKPLFFDHDAEEIGELFLVGPEITFRGQPHGTFKFLFNAIYYGK
jgi:ABC-type glycerol-3-phosphate transport system permease component